MAKKLQHVWGLEIGQCSLKALRCHLENDNVVADAFDFVEYPKILSQPEAEPEALISDALQQFTSRNDLRNSVVAVSVPGQSGLAKFFKPPPVEVKTISKIVKYEAKQQIPFDLKDVIWDYQQMEGAQIEDGFALESEVGLFAMKREAVFRALKPYREKQIDIDLVQLAPISIYNMIAFDRFAERIATEQFNPDAPQKSLVVLSIGTDASDLIVTNGFRVWQRNIPIGGNHFTRQLTKDLKLTFAKAEHLKRNALHADDPKLVFQAMRPVFNDMVTEIQRSLNFYKTVNKKGELESMLLLGNTSKLPGLQQFLNKNLGMDVHSLEKFPKLEGTEVVGAQAFKDNVPAYGVVYGLCLQLLKRGPMKTNLLPRDIVIERVIRNKKPWTVGALSLLLGGMAAYHATRGQAYSVVDPALWKSAESAAESMSKQSSSEFSTDSSLNGEIKKFQEVGKEVSSGASRRVQTLELLKVIEGSLNKNPELADKTPIELPYKDRQDFHIERIEQKYYPELERWFRPSLQKSYMAGVKSRRQWFAPDRVHEEVPEPTPLSGPGWVIELKGYHYFNGIRGEEGPEHVLKHMVEYLENGSIALPITNRIGISEPKKATDETSEDNVATDTDAEGADAGTGEETPKKPIVPELPEGHVAIRDLGIRLPVIRVSNQVNTKNVVPNPAYLERYKELQQKQARSAAIGGDSFGAPGAMGAGMPSSGGFPGGNSFPGMSGGMPPGFGSSGYGESGGGSGMSPSGGSNINYPQITDEAGNEIPPTFEAPRYDFVLQFAWQPRFEPNGGSLAGGLITGDAQDGDTTSSSATTKTSSGTNDE